MKTHFVCAFILPVLAACATPEANDNLASANDQENVYSTGSNLPTRQNKKNKQNIQTISADQAAEMIRPAASRLPNN